MANLYDFLNIHTSIPTSGDELGATLLSLLMRGILSSLFLSLVISISLPFMLFEAPPGCSNKLDLPRLAVLPPR